MDVLSEWIKNIGKDEPKIDLQNHIIKHALEIFEERHEEDPKSWMASMLNLVDIYGAIRGVEAPSAELRIQRLMKKHKSDPQRYKGPPMAFCEMVAMSMKLPSVKKYNNNNKEPE